MPHDETTSGYRIVMSAAIPAKISMGDVRRGLREFFPASRRARWCTARHGSVPTRRRSSALPWTDEFLVLSRRGDVTPPGCGASRSMRSTPRFCLRARERP